MNYTDEEYEEIENDVISNYDGHIWLSQMWNCNELRRNL